MRVFLLIAVMVLSGCAAKEADAFDETAVGAAASPLPSDPPKNTTAEAPVGVPGPGEGVERDHQCSTGPTSGGLSLGGAGLRFDCRMTSISGAFVLVAVEAPAGCVVEVGKGFDRQPASAGDEFEDGGDLVGDCDASVYVLGDPLVRATVRTWT